MTFLKVGSATLAAPSLIEGTEFAFDLSRETREEVELYEDLELRGKFALGHRTWPLKGEKWQSTWKLKMAARA